MGYKFIKSEMVVGNSTLEYGWRLAISDISTLNEFHEKYIQPQVKRGFEELIHKDPNSHFKTVWGSTIHTHQLAMSLKKPTSVIEAGCDLTGKIYEGQVRCIMKGHTLLLNEIGSYFFITEDLKITNELVTSKMVWPNYTKLDIRVFQWTNGEHWYAKLGGLDVVDPQGNQKWDKKDDAEQAAINFYNEMM